MAQEKIKYRTKPTPIRNFVFGASLAFNVCGYLFYTGILMRNPDAPVQEVALYKDDDWLSRIAGR